MKFSVKYRSVDSDIYVIMYICVCVYICIYMRNIDTTLLTEIIRIQAFMRIKVNCDRKSMCAVIYYG